MTASAERRPTAVGPVLLAVAMVLVALNLRTPITSIPPLLVTISEQLGLTGAAGGLLTTLPVVCMGVFAPVAQRYARRVGREVVAAVGLGLVFVGTVIRLAGDVVMLLYLGVLLAGAGLAIIGAVLPGVVKEYFASRPGLVTGLYMGGMMAGAAVAAQLAVPLADLLGSWQRSLASWSVLALVAAVVWRPVLAEGRRRHAAAPPPSQRGLPWRSGTAWLVSGFLLCNSWTFYTQVSWIPATYELLGYSAASAAALLTVFTVAQALSGIGVPALADRVRDMRMLLFPTVICGAAGTLAVTAMPLAAPVVWMVVLGLGLGASFALGLVLLVAYASGPTASERLTAMAFLVSYALAAVGPVVFGAILDATGGVRVPWLVMVAVCLVQLCLVAGMGPQRQPVS